MKSNSFCQACMDHYRSLMSRFARSEVLICTIPEDHSECHHGRLDPSLDIQSPAKLIRSMTVNHSADAEAFQDEHRRSQLQDLAREFHRTCEDDWSAGQEVAFGGRLRQLYVNGHMRYAVKTYSTIRYRLDLALFTDKLVAHFALPRPFQQSCLAWTRVDWNSEILDARPGWLERKFQVDLLLEEGEFEFHPADDQGPPFYRPRWYLTACLVEMDISGKDLEAKVSEICECVKLAKRMGEQGCF